MISVRFADRADAGRQLAAALAEYADRDDVVVLALPRGGVPVGFQVATALRVPLDILIVRKLGVPGHPELAMGAISSGGVQVLSGEVINHLGIPAEVVRQVAEREALELARRERAYRGERDLPALRDRTVILIDDGLATGATMEAGVMAVRAFSPASIVVAAPVGAPETTQRLSRVADRVVCVRTPDPFDAVGLWYHDFTQTSDDEVARLLASALRRT